MSEERIEPTVDAVDYGSLVEGDFKAEDGVFAVAYVDPDDISVTKRIRKSAESGALVRSIRDIGLLKPITVAPIGEDSYVLVDGLRRLNACIEAGMTKVPCIVAKSVKTSDIPVMASVYNHAQSYSNTEISAYVDYLLSERGVHDYNSIEYLLQLETGEVAKLQDLKADNDPELTEKLFADELSISAAFKKLEARRKKESKEEKLRKQAERAYDTGEGLNEAGERGGVGDSDRAEDGAPKRKAFNAQELDEGIEEKSLDEMVSESDATAGFKPNKQKVGQRERIDPTIRKATLARDNYTCQCCRRGGESYVDSLDFHHVTPVSLGGDDSVSNGVTLCVLCHRLVHLFGNGQLAIPASKPTEELEALSAEDRAVYEDDLLRFKRVVMLGQTIRDGYAQRGIDRKKAREMFPTDSVGRKKPSEGLNSQELDGVSAG
ncbi:hypothetical protein FACS1894208_00920 [Clostridia bacterium]|nr:hypothetical protein FACS1894208_00920 [Clostridia bacterium]